MGAELCKDRFERRYVLCGWRGPSDGFGAECCDEFGVSHRRDSLDVLLCVVWGGGGVVDAERDVDDVGGGRACVVWGGCRVVEVERVVIAASAPGEYGHCCAGSESESHQSVQDRRVTRVRVRLGRSFMVSSGIEWTCQWMLRRDRIGRIGRFLKSGGAEPYWFGRSRRRRVVERANKCAPRAFEA